MVAELWLIVELTSSGTALGLHSVFRFGPILFFGVFTGVLGDRMDRRRILLVTQALHAAATTTLAVIVWMTTPTLALVYGIILTQGLINAVDNPVRRSFIRDLTTDDEISNAVSLHNTVGTLTRAIGPAIAGLLISGLGVEWCFTINAATYVAVLVSLVSIDRRNLRPSVPVPRGSGQLRAGVRYAWTHRPIRVTLGLTFLMAVFAWQWSVILPVYARDEFLGDATLFGLLVSTLSVGSVFGAFLSAKQLRLGGRHLRIAGAALALGLGVSALAPHLSVALVGLLLVGAAGSAFNIGAQSRIQLAVEDSMTSRVMSLYSVGFTGAKPIGGMLAGVAIDSWGSRQAFGLGAVVTAASIGLYGLAKRSDARDRSTSGVL